MPSVSPGFDSRLAENGFKTVETVTRQILRVGGDLFSCFCFITTATPNPKSVALESESATRDAPARLCPLGGRLVIYSAGVGSSTSCCSGPNGSSIIGLAIATGVTRGRSRGTHASARTPTRGGVRRSPRASGTVSSSLLHCWRSFCSFLFGNGWVLGVWGFVKLFWGLFCIPAAGHPS